MTPSSVNQDYGAQETDRYSVPQSTLC